MYWTLTFMPSTSGRRLTFGFLMGVLACFPGARGVAQDAKGQREASTRLLEFTTKLETVTSGFDGKTCWVAPRVGIVPGPRPVAVLTTQKLLLKGSDVFYDMNEFRSEDLGVTWSGPVEHTTLGRRKLPDGGEIIIADFTPTWHARTGKLLGTGPTIRYHKNAAGFELKISQDLAPARTAYSVYDAERRTWTPWEMVVMPELPKFFYATVGASQRVDLPNGEILLPFHFKSSGVGPYRSAVMRCSFDGRKLTYLEHGDELARPVEEGVVYNLPGSRQTGVFEPSLTRFRGRYYLTMRNDRTAYVATSEDGLHFGPVQRWRFDDEADLGSRNTQQHWVTHSEGLFLVYTRVGANNDHVFRHRAPIFIAQVDPVKLRVIRSTERILIPERGAGLGNTFGVTEVNEHETWVTSAEWMQGPKGIMKPGNEYGSDNSVYVARVLWPVPNRAVAALMPAQGAVTAAPIEQSDVFISREKGYYSYRVPSAVVSNAGTVLVFAEGRRNNEGDVGDIDILLRRSFDGGRTWRPVQRVWDEGMNGCGNITTVVDRTTGVIWLLAIHSPGNETEELLWAGRSKGDRTVWVMKSSDDGATWSKPVDITRSVKRPEWGYYATGPGTGIQLRSGRLVIPCNFRPRLPAGATHSEMKESTRSHVVYSDDHGATWAIGGVLEAKTNECQVAELPDGRLSINMRSFHGKNLRAVATSRDGGMSWSKPELHPELIEPICQASLQGYVYDDARQRSRLLFSNPASVRRENMTVRLSYDGGETWPYSQVLHPGPSAYSCLTVLSDNSIGCVYERRVNPEKGQTPYERITFARFTLDWLSGGADSLSR